MSVVPLDFAPPLLLCPECRAAGRAGACRIGGRRTACRTCNRFAQAVRRQLGVALAEAHPVTADRLRPAIEGRVYASIAGEL